jgi:hypothetical protein
MKNITTTIHKKATKLVKMVAKKHKMKFDDKDLVRLTKYAANVMGNPITPDNEVEGVVLTMMHITQESNK